MATLKKRVSFFESEEGIAVRDKLQRMASDSAFNTSSSYSANAEAYPSNVISFTDKHMNYLNAHPAVDPQQYLANLRLMTRLK
jgi:hypothetical protein